MKFIIELTDRQLSTIKDALKITYADFEKAFQCDTPLNPTTQFDYAIRILRAREALDLSNSDSECVSDVENIPKRETVVVP